MSLPLDSYSGTPLCFSRIFGLRAQPALGIRPLLLLTLAFIMASGGCAVPYKWKTKMCYEGPPRAFSDISVVLLNTRSLLVFRVRSIDGTSMPDSVEYHLLPGTHSIVTGVSRGQTTEMPITCELRPGYVYSLTADVWNLSSKFDLLLGFQKVECDWRPRLVELGRFDELTSGEYVNRAIIEQTRPRPLSFMILARENATPIGEGSLHAHYVGVGHYGPSVLLAYVMPVEMPPKHWGPLPKNWRTARLDAKGDEAWGSRSDRP